MVDYCISKVDRKGMGVSRKPCVAEPRNGGNMQLAS